MDITVTMARGLLMPRPMPKLISLFSTALLDMVGIGTEWSVGSIVIGRVGRVSSIAIGRVGRVSTRSKSAVEKSGISFGIGLGLGISRPLAIVTVISIGVGRVSVGTETVGRVGRVSTISKSAVEKSGISLGFGLGLSISRPLAIVTIISIGVGRVSIGTETV